MLLFLTGYARSPRRERDYHVACLSVWARACAGAAASVVPQMLYNALIRRFISSHRASQLSNQVSSLLHSPRSPLIINVSVVLDPFSLPLQPHWSVLSWRTMSSVLTLRCSRQRGPPPRMPRSATVSVYIFAASRSPLNIRRAVTAVWVREHYKDECFIVVERGAANENGDGSMSFKIGHKPRVS